MPKPPVKVIPPVIATKPPVKVVPPVKTQPPAKPIQTGSKAVMNVPKQQSSESGGGLHWVWIVLIGMFGVLRRYRDRTCMEQVYDFRLISKKNSNQVQKTAELF